MDDTEVQGVARRRYISTKISLDKEVSRIAREHGDFAALVYTWGIPHAEEDATLTGDPEELLAQVAPLRRDKTPADMEHVMTTLADAGLLLWNRPQNLTQYPIESFYEYQTNVHVEKRRTENVANDYRKTAKSSGEQRRTAESSASSSLSSSPSISLSIGASRTKIDYDDDFLEFWSLYPRTRQQSKKEAYKCWLARLKEKGVAPERIINATRNYAALCLQERREEKYIAQPSTFLGPNEKWQPHEEFVATLATEFRPYSEFDQ
jgi:hypothetical protein